MGFIKIPELRDRLGVSESTARKYVKNGTIPAYKIGPVYKIDERDLEEFIERNKLPKAQAQPKEDGSRKGAAPAQERNRHYRETAEMGEIACAYWEERLEDEAGLSNDEVYSLASVLKPYSNALEAATSSELRHLRAQHPNEEDLRPRSLIEPVRFRWVSILITASRRRIFDFPNDPDARHRFKDLVDSLDAQAREYV